MRTDRMRRSENVEDRRRAGPRVAVGGGVGTLIIVLLVVLLGGNPQALLQQGGPTGGYPGGPAGVQPGTTGTTDPREEKLADLVRAVLGDTEDVWQELFRAQGQEYVPPSLVLFSGEVRSACGQAGASVGPFYCPADRTIYIDLSFYGELSERFGAPGDFAQAYVIAHEVGHHVQHLLGTSERIQLARQQLDEARGNDLSVRLELQADYYAGVWAHHADRARGVLEAGDIEEGIRAAGAIGDDRLQLRSRGFVVPDSFTHGSSEQRVRWFTRGLESGDPAKGDTFSSKDL